MIPDFKICRLCKHCLIESWYESEECGSIISKSWGHQQLRDSKPVWDESMPGEDAAKGVNKSGLFFRCEYSSWGWKTMCKFTAEHAVSQK